MLPVEVRKIQLNYQERLRIRLTSSQKKIVKLKRIHVILSVMDKEEFAEALRGLVMKVGIAGTARLIGVSESTIYRWLSMFDVVYEVRRPTVDGLGLGEKAWMAGAIDCDGSVSLVKYTSENGYVYLCPRISFGNTDRKMVEYIAELWRGRIYVEDKSPKGRLCYKTCRSAKAALHILKALKPFIKCSWKKKRVKWIFEHFSLQKPSIFCGIGENGKMVAEMYMSSFPPATP